MYACMYVNNWMRQDRTAEVNVVPQCRNTNTQQTSSKIVTLGRNQVTAGVKPSMKYKLTMK